MKSSALLPEAQFKLVSFETEATILYKSTTKRLHPEIRKKTSSSIDTNSRRAHQPKTIPHSKVVGEQPWLPFGSHLEAGFSPGTRHIHSVIDG